MPSMEQIAGRAGVSRASVSLVLNDVPNARIGAQTRKRILETAAEMGYVSKQRPSTMRAIAYVLMYDPQYVVLGSPWTAFVLTALQNIAREDHRSVLYMAAPHHDDSHVGLIEQLEEVRPSGIVLDGRYPDSLVSEMEKLNIPLVLAANPIETDEQLKPTVDHDTVSVDIGQSVCRLMDHLAERGAEAIGLVTHPLHLPYDHAVLEAYQLWHQQNDRPLRPERVQICHDPDMGVELLIRLNSLGISLDGLLFGSPNLARSIINALHYGQARLNDAPKALALLGHPEQHNGGLRRAVLCGCDATQFAGALYKLLVSAINNTQRRPRHINVPTRLYLPDL